jgi:hypothetical protein
LVLLCVPAGIGAKKIFEKKNSAVMALKTLLVVLVILVFLFGATKTAEKIGKPKHLLWKTYYGYISQVIPNDHKSVVYYANHFGLILGMEKATIYDFSSFKEFSLPACNFLKQKGINWVVYKLKDNRFISNKEFLSDLKSAMDENTCVELVPNKLDLEEEFVRVYKVK